MINLCRIEKIRKRSGQLHFQKTDVTLWLSLQNQRPGLTARSDIGAQAPPSRLQALFLCLHILFMAAVRGIPSGMPGSFVPGPSTCVQLPPLFV